MRSLRSAYVSIFTKERRRSFGVALLLLALALTFQYYASSYSSNRALQFVGDVFLDNFPVINMNPIIVEGALLAIAFSIVLVLVKPKYLIFSVKTAAVFIAARAFFIAITHLGFYPGQVQPSVGYFDQLYVRFGLEGGYFFSSHTGLPFLMGLIFWKEKLWRNIFFAMSALFGVSVLLAHVHYSIDVFAAPFMSYSIFKWSEYLFKQDEEIITSG